MSIETPGYNPSKEEIDPKIKEAYEKIGALIRKTKAEYSDSHNQKDLNIEIKNKGEKINPPKTKSITEAYKNTFLDDGGDEEDRRYLDEKIKIEEQRKIIASLKPETVARIEKTRKRKENELTGPKLQKYYDEKAEAIIQQTKPAIDKFYSEQKNT